MSDDAEMLRVPAVRFTRVLPGPIERVWAHLVDASLLKDWFGEGSIEHRAGGTVRLKGGHIRGVVTIWEPPRRLAYSWNVFQGDETVSRFPESYLRLELSPQGDAVTLTLTHLPILDAFERLNAVGWHTYLDLIVAALSGAPAEGVRARMERNAVRYGVTLPPRPDRA